MSEVNENLNEQVEEEVDDATVVTVPIDETLSRHGEAADAKAVGEALDLKADKSEISQNITVNGQSKDNQGNIQVNAEHVPYATGKSVKQKLDDIDGKTAEDIYMSDGDNPQTVAEAIENAGSKTADQIPMAEGSIETVGERIGSIEDDIEEVSGALEDYETATDSDIAEIQADLVELTDAEVHAIVSEVFEGESEEE